MNIEVYRRDDSRYWYYDLTVAGVRHRHSTRRTKESEAKVVAATALKAHLDREQLGGVPDITLREALFDHYLPSVSRAASYVHLKRYCEYLVGDRPVSKALRGGMKMHEVTTSTLRRYRADRQRAGMSDQSIDHEIKCVSAAYNLIKEDFHVRAGLTFPMARPKGHPRFLLPEEETALLAELDPLMIRVKGGGRQLNRPLARTAKQRADNHDLVVMLLDTGCRYGEIAHLTWAMVDTRDFAWVHIFREKVQNEGRLSTTTRMQTVLRRRFADRGNSAYVFAGWRRDGQDEPRQTTAAIRRAMARIGINHPAKVARFGRRDVRSLRDTFASKLRKGDRAHGIPGMALDRLQKLLGHSSPQMTQKYADLAVDPVSDEAVSALNQLNGG